MKANPILSGAILYGLALGVLINLLLPFLLLGDKAYLGDDNVSLLMFSLFAVVCFLLLKNHTDKHTNGTVNLAQLLILMTGFSVVVAVCIGLGHFINATFIDPLWAEKSLELLQQKWAENNYSETAIAGQVEWTDTFHNPIKWGAVLSVFFTTLFSLLGIVLVFIFYFLHRLFQRQEFPNENAEQFTF